MENGTWEIVEYPNNKKPTGTRFVFKTKLSKDGNKERRKARLVGKGFTQIPGTDFNDTFAPVSRSSTIRLVMALSVELGLIVHQMDVVTAFLNGQVEEELYMLIPERFQFVLEKKIERNNNRNAVAIAKKWLKDCINGNKKACRLR